MKQYKEENLVQFTERFKHEKSVIGVFQENNPTNDKAPGNACRQNVQLAASKRGRVEVLFTSHDHKQA